MARLPQGGRAILDMRKIEDYCLDPRHLHGRHKARVFLRALALTRADSIWLGQALLEGVRENDATEIATDRFGTQWRVDVPITRHGQHAVVRTVWIVRTGEDVPRFVTCWVR